MCCGVGSTNIMSQFKQAQQSPYQNPNQQVVGNITRVTPPTFNSKDYTPVFATNGHLKFIRKPNPNV